MSVVAILGGTGFIGSSIAAAAQDRGHSALIVRAPRYDSRNVRLSELDAFLSGRIADQIASEIAGADVLINAAGVADATAKVAADLLFPNAYLPRLAQVAADRAGCARYVHISSAGVQGRLRVLTEQFLTQPMGPYTESKALGECLLERSPTTVIFRPTSVHGADRRVTRRLFDFTRSRMATVAGDGNHPTPQVLLPNVASAVCFTAFHPGDPAAVVLQPWEGLSTADIVRLLGDQEPHKVPERLAWLACGMILAAGRRSARVSAHARRLEMVLFGQGQVAGWLSEAGWTPPIGLQGWRSLSQELSDRKAQNSQQ